MICIFKGQFRRDAGKIRNRLVREEISKVIGIVKQAEKVSQIPRLVKLKHYSTHYRIEIQSNYRIGVVVRGNRFWFVRVLHRSQIYKEFP
jgi:hypothetical protein